MGLNLRNVIEQVGKDKGLDKAILIDTLETAMVKAAEKKHGPNKLIEAHYNDELGEIELFQFKTVVENVANPDKEISVAEAHELDPEAVLGDSLGIKLDTSEFGRIAAQTAKQIIIQKMREAERDVVYSEYVNKRGEIVTGIVHTFERGDIMVDLGRTEAVLPKEEQVRRESYRQGDRIRALILDVKNVQKGPQIILSRTHPNFISKLFETEVPEIYEGIINIKGVAREPGDRTKIAVYSNDQAVDPVGACVGVKGSRVQAVVQELRGEKIDIVPWSDEPAKFICNALLPAQIARVIIDETEHSMEVIVPDDQLSLAIGKKGQNVRLAAKLTGWKIDINTETEAKKMALEQAAIETTEKPAEAEVSEQETPATSDVSEERDISSLPGVGPKTLEALKNAGLNTAEDILNAGVESLSAISGIGAKKAEKLLEAARQLAEGH
ncbi:MAG: transcription termination/antitermination protein NusA [Deltaproteobacteria bacterium GWC2_42_51]|nr:MAG: transcription termination/antitermination protein NusA [Deltaproteobacteria bacterium GWA2_42_85]OGP28562.1 MAG: transcription termination/antitermination protein NusA [Deltaproteobacteria bacterium GWB2_42_7]OGP32873.1 MAG: transcription termination/antitermination protein NusA [Deltaproteobacteria bacterium GWC2_42_51]OGP40719.1 MAG: transcription termination/antitermination protein NusA [Deltaproteobacteria bacterium GWD2_42_10]OGP47267.1 MAG: transcription termination/antiterminatio